MARQFNIERIERSLQQFRKDFAAINDSLSMRREVFQENMMHQILEAYSFLNDLLRKDMDLFTPAGLHSLLEMNHIVLCGSSKETRMQYYQHLNETRKSFTAKITPILEWVMKNRDQTSPYILATGFYSRQLSQPQLFIEGNHRTGNILLNYLLISKGSAPYIISTKDARDYLDISGDIKFTYRESSFESTLKMPGHRKRFIKFLEEHTDEQYLAGH